MKTHSEKIREAVTDLGEASPNEIMEWIKKHYPDESVNAQSYRADIIGCSKNHTSEKHYPNMPKFLLFNKNVKKYRLDPNETLQFPLPESPRFDAFLEQNCRTTEKSIEVKSAENNCIDGIPVSKLSITGQVDIPLSIRTKMGLNPGDTIAFVETEKTIEIRKARIKLDFS